MKYNWKRPLSEHQHYPLIYSVFDVVNAEGENVGTFRIEDVSEDRFEEAVQLMKENYVMEDPMMNSKRVFDDLVSLKEITEDWNHVLEQKISIVCYEEETKEIAGLCFLSVMTEDEFFEAKPQGESWSEIKKVKRFIKDIFFNPFEHYGVDSLMCSAGTFISKKFEFPEIEKEMIKVRKDIGVAFEVKVSSDFFTTATSQITAEQCGYDENFSIDYKKLPKLLCEGFFPAIKEEKLKILSKKFY